MTHESAIIVFRPPLDPDVVLAMRLFVSELPKIMRRFFVGPITGDDGSRSFVVIPNCSTKIEIQPKLEEFLAKAKKHKADIIYVQFGDDISLIKFSTDKEIHSNNEAAVLKLRSLKIKNTVLTKELDKLEKWRRQDLIVDEAIEAMNLLFFYKDGLDFLLENYQNLDKSDVALTLKQIMESATEKKKRQEKIPLLLTCAEESLEKEPSFWYDGPYSNKEGETHAGTFKEAERGNLDW